MMKVIMVDLDGTLFDTKEVNYRAYKESIAPYGFDIDYKYYCKFCNGRHYMDFLPQITTYDETILAEMHRRKKKIYGSYLNFARLNWSLVTILRNCSHECKIALVTTASKQNTFEILKKFDLVNIFDLILTQEDVSKLKPDPEGYIKVMRFFSVNPEECMIFEDSDIGIEAALRSGATVFTVKGYN